MKNAYVVISLLLFVLIVGCSNQSSLSNKAEDHIIDIATTPLVEDDTLTNEIALAKRIAWDSLSEEEIKTIDPFKQETTRKVHAGMIPLRIDEDSSPTNVYKVTYFTDKDPLLGPIGIYIDVDNAEIVGHDIRQ